MPITADERRSKGKKLVRTYIQGALKLDHLKSS